MATARVFYYDHFFITDYGWVFLWAVVLIVFINPWDFRRLRHSDSALTEFAAFLCMFTMRLNGWASAFRQWASRRELRRCTNRRDIS